MSTCEPVVAAAAADCESEIRRDDPKTAVIESQIVRAPRVKKSKFALFFSYCGYGYHGLQRNKGFQTIEEELLTALHKSDLITEDEFENPHTMYFQRAARTDKGVSAAVQLVSIVLPNPIAESVDKVNQHLPRQINILGAIKSTKYFDSKNYCDGRTYSYMMPTFALAPPDTLTSEDFRADAKLMKQFNQVLSIYQGTHNFHNFTSQKVPTDPSSLRFILSIEASDPFMKDDLEMTVVRIRGQSFMLHQIRKMIGMVLAVMRGFATVERLRECFKADKVDIPRAPGVGLMLEDVHYDKYNQKFGGDGIHEPISWSRWSEAVAKFKDEVIYPVMIETEKKEKSMMEWLNTLPLHTYEGREPGPPGQKVRNRTDFGKAYSNVEKVREEDEDEDEECIENEEDCGKAGDDKIDNEVESSPAKKVRISPQ